MGFFYEQRSLGCEILRAEHTEFITPLVSTSQSNERISFCLEWINELSTGKTLSHFATALAIFMQKNTKKTGMIPDCQNVKITCSKNAWDLHFLKISRSKFYMFYSMCKNQLVYKFMVWNTAKHI